MPPFRWRFFDDQSEIGPGLRLADGRVIFFGATSQTAIYTPSGSTSPGMWVAGPNIPGDNGCDDAPGAVLRDGTVLIATGPSGTYNSPVTFYIYNPASNSFSLAAPLSNNFVPFGSRMLALPNGDVLFNDGSNGLAAKHIVVATPVS